MPEYQFYTIARDGHIKGPPIDVEAPDDVMAISKAREIQNGRDIEVWQGARVVAYLTPDSKA